MREWRSWRRGDALARITFLIEDPRDRLAGLLLDFRVEIDEIPTQPFGKQPPDRGFPAAHEADEIDAWSGLEALMHDFGQSGRR